MDAREAERKLDEWVNDDDCVLSFDEKREIRNAVDWERTTLRADIEAKDAELAASKERIQQLYASHERKDEEILQLNLEAAEGRTCMDKDERRIAGLERQLAEAKKLLADTIPQLMIVKLPKHTMLEDLAQQEFHNLSVLRLRAAIDEAKGGE